MIYKFDDIVIDTSSYSMMRNGEIVPVEPKSFDLLALLVQNPNRLVSRRKIFEVIWAGKSVSDATLTGHIKAIRSVLGDDGIRQHYIKTIHGRGYQFTSENLVELDDTIGSSERDYNQQHDPVGENTDNRDSAHLGSSSLVTHLASPAVTSRGVTEISQQGQVVSRDRFDIVNQFKALLGAGSKTSDTSVLRITAWLLLIALLLVNLIMQTDDNLNSDSSIDPKFAKSLAVLPFENQSQIEVDGSFTDGIHSDLLTQLSKIRDIKTISRTSVMLYRKSTKKVDEIANELGVANIITGSVQRANNQIRITVHLIDALKDESLWAETYTRELTTSNIFAIQSEISFAVAKALKTMLSPDEERSIKSLPTQNMAALEAYFQAIEYIGIARTAESHFMALEKLKHAIEIDPNFSVALSKLANLELGGVFYTGRPIDEVLHSTKQQIDRALEIDDQLTDAYVALAKWHMLQKHFKEAEENFERAIAINPNDGDALHSYAVYLLWWSGDHQKALTVMEINQSIDPLSNKHKQVFADALTANGRFAEAHKLLQELLAKSPESPHVMRSLSFLLSEGYFRFDEAIVLREKIMAIDPGVSWDAVATAQLFMKLGDYDQALHWFERAREMTTEPSNSAALSGLIYEMSGQLDKALDAYFSVKKDSKFVPNVVHSVAKLCLDKPCAVEAVGYILALCPELAGPNPTIDRANYTSAIALASLYISQTQAHESTQNDKLVNHLLTSSLEFAQNASYLNWGNKNALWEARAYILLQQNDKALKVLKSYVDSGGHNMSIANDVDFFALQGFAEMKDLVQRMEQKRLTQLEQLSKFNTVQGSGL